MRHQGRSNLGLDHSQGGAYLQGFGSVLVPGPEGTADLFAEEGSDRQSVGCGLSLQAGVQPAPGSIPGNVPSLGQLQEIRSGPVKSDQELIGQGSDPEAVERPRYRIFRSRFYGICPLGMLKNQ
jgi:hypothetical protein